MQDSENKSPEVRREKSPTPVQAWDFLYEVVPLDVGGQKRPCRCWNAQGFVRLTAAPSQMLSGILLAQTVTPAVMSRGCETAARACEKN
jgi:hypothetical protein